MWRLQPEAEALLLVSILAAAAPVSDWSYVARAASLPGGGPAAVRAAGPDEPALVTCDRRTGKILIAGGPPHARSARLMGDASEMSYRLLRGGNGGIFLPVHSRSQLFDDVVAERRPLMLAFDTGQRSTIAPARAVARVVRECRSVAPTWVPLR